VIINEGITYGNLFDFNLVSFLVGGFPVVERVVYVLVGLSALVEVFNHSASCKWCGK
jgi:uncharacterized membrane protein YuzA (DUF378 family)